MEEDFSLAIHSIKAVNPIKEHKIFFAPNVYHKFGYLKNPKMNLPRRFK